jgi:sialic acid synthase SpsE
VAALTAGANLVEVHFTLSKRLPGPDQACSHEPEQLKQICDFARQRHVVMSSVKEFWDAEHEKLDLFRKNTEGAKA